MASVRRHRGRWVCDYRDVYGKRRTPSFRTRAEAHDFLPTALMAEQRRKWNAGPLRSPFPLDITVAGYARHWVDVALVTLTAATHGSYLSALRNHILPQLGPLRLSALTRLRLKVWFAELVISGLSTATARKALSVLRLMLADAIDDEAFPRTASGADSPNPAAGLERAMRLPRQRGRDD